MENKRVQRLYLLQQHSLLQMNCSDVCVTARPCNRYDFWIGAVYGWGSVISSPITNRITSSNSTDIMMYSTGSGEATIFAHSSLIYYEHSLCFQLLKARGSACSWRTWTGTALVIFTLSLSNTNRAPLLLSRLANRSFFRCQRHISNVGLRPTTHRDGSLTGEVNPPYSPSLTRLRRAPRDARW